MNKCCNNCIFFYDDYDENEYKRYYCPIMDAYTFPHSFCHAYKENLNEDVKA